MKQLTNLLWLNPSKPKQIPKSKFQTENGDELH